MKWIFTGGPVRSFLASSGAADYKKATMYMGDFVGTVGLGGAVMTKMPEPATIAMGHILQKFAKLAKYVLFALKGIAKLRKTLF